MAPDPKIVAVAKAAIEMEDEAGLPDGNVDSGREAMFVCGRAVRSKGIDMDGIVGNSPWDPSIEDVDCTADRLASEQKNRWPVENFDPVGSDRIDGDCMVGRSVGNVDRADPVDQHSNPLPLEAAKDRSGGARPEGGRRYARQSGQGFTQLGTHVANQVAAAQSRGSGKKVEIADERRRDDDLFLDLTMDMIVGGPVRCGRILIGGGRLSGGREGNESRSGKQERVQTHDRYILQLSTPDGAVVTLYHTPC